jgi:hypothetical protein
MLAKSLIATALYGNGQWEAAVALSTKFVGAHNAYPLEVRAKTLGFTTEGEAEIREIYTTLKEQPHANRDVYEQLLLLQSDDDFRAQACREAKRRKGANQELLDYIGNDQLDEVAEDRLREKAKTNGALYQAQFVIAVKHLRYDSPRAAELLNECGEADLPGFAFGYSKRLQNDANWPVRTTLAQ